MRAREHPFFWGKGGPKICKLRRVSGGVPPPLAFSFFPPVGTRSAPLYFSSPCFRRLSPLVRFPRQSARLNPPTVPAANNIRGGGVGPPTLVRVHSFFFFVHFFLPIFPEIPPPRRGAAKEQRVSFFPPPCCVIRLPGASFFFFFFFLSPLFGPARRGENRVFPFFFFFPWRNELVFQLLPGARNGRRGRPFTNAQTHPLVPTGELFFFGCGRPVCSLWCHRLTQAASPPISPPPFSPPFAKRAV